MRSMRESTEEYRKVMKPIIRKLHEYIKTYIELYQKYLLENRDAKKEEKN